MSVLIVIQKKICPYGDRQQPLETAMHSIIRIQLPEEYVRSTFPAQSIEYSGFFSIDKRLRIHEIRCVKVEIFFTMAVDDSYIKSR